MRKETFYYEGELFERCTLTKARQAYNTGSTVILAPINAAMFHGVNSLWIPVNRDFYSCEGHTFRQVLNNFEYYNLHQGTGNYTKYFIKR